MRSVNAPRVLSPLRAVEARTTLAIRRGEPLLRAGFTSSTLGAILEGVIFEQVGKNVIFKIAQ